MDKEIRKALTPIRSGVRGFYEEIATTCNTTSASVSRILNGKQPDNCGVIDKAKEVAIRENEKAELQKEQLLQKISA